MRLCTELDCGKPVEARGLCPSHYQLWRIHRTDNPRCAEDDCPKGIYAKGLCKRHYDRSRMLNPSKARCSVTGCDKPRNSRGLCSGHYHFHRTYGVDPEKYEAHLQAREGVCEICGAQSDRLCLDHDHESGVLRGLICHSCNVAIGHVREDPTILRKILAYLERPEPDLTYLM